MNIKVSLLETPEQALAVAQCVYAEHGLTYHRHWLYEPARVLANNRQGNVTSFVAMIGDHCVAHAAASHSHTQPPAAAAEASAASTSICVGWAPSVASSPAASIASL